MKRGVDVLGGHRPDRLAVDGDDLVADAEAGPRGRQIRRHFARVEPAVSVVLTEVGAHGAGPAGAAS